MPERWIAERTRLFDSSGIRKVFDLARSLPDPINLSIGQPDFDVPEPVRQSCIEAIEAGKVEDLADPAAVKKSRAFGDPSLGHEVSLQEYGVSVVQGVGGGRN